MNTISEVTVERDASGYWSHPAFEALFGGREYVSDSEFRGWLHGLGMEHTTVVLDDEDSAAYQAWAESGSLAGWEPERPEGEGWFTAAIYDAECDGPVCIWLRPVP